MDLSEIENGILAELYQAWHRSERTIDLTPLLENKGWDESVVEKLTAQMEHKGLIRPPDWGYDLTAKGILHVENLSIAPEDLNRQNNDVRSILLIALSRTYEAEGPHSFMHYTDLANEHDLDEELSFNNLELLRELRYIENPGVGCYRISQYGLEKVNQHREKQAIADEFERVSQMMPQPRGMALQKLLAKVIENQAWHQLEGVRTLNEEMDVIVYRGREYYFIECKWEKDPVQTEVVDKLVGKLVRRPDVKGVIASMSGFTRGIVEAVKGHANTRVTLLFGPEDLRSMIHSRITFEELIDEKYRQLVIHRKVVFK